MRENLWKKERHRHYTNLIDHQLGPYLKTKIPETLREKQRGCNLSKKWIQQWI